MKSSFNEHVLGGYSISHPVLCLKIHEGTKAPGCSLQAHSLTNSFYLLVITQDEKGDETSLPRTGSLPGTRRKRDFQKKIPIQYQAAPN